jgi:hypothetical protein
MRDDHKFKSLVHYVVSTRRNAPETLGAVKLNKILWLSDLSSYYRRGKPITSSRYKKEEFGPVPAQIMPVLRELEREGVLTVSDAPHYGKRKTEYRVHKPDERTDFLDPQEVKIVNKMINYVCDGHTATSISNASHDHIWQAAVDGEDIPLFTVFARPGRITDIVLQWAQMKLEEESE